MSYEIYSYLYILSKGNNKTIDVGGSSWDQPPDGKPALLNSWIQTWVPTIPYPLKLVRTTNHHHVFFHKTYRKTTFFSSNRISTYFSLGSLDTSPGRPWAPAAGQHQTLWWAQCALSSMAPGAFRKGGGRDVRSQAQCASATNHGMVTVCYKLPQWYYLIFTHICIYINIETIILCTVFRMNDGFAYI